MMLQRKEQCVRRLETFLVTLSAHVCRCEGFPAIYPGDPNPQQDQRANELTVRGGGAI